MKAKEILKRTYYALTIGLLMCGLMLLLSTTINGHRWDYIEISFGTLLALGICWIMTRQSKPLNFKWYAGIIIALTLLYVYIPRLCGGCTRETNEILAYAIIGSYIACAVISTFFSNTKYYNILPNQPKGVSRMFRILSWIGQFIVWALVVLWLIAVLSEK